MKKCSKFILIIATIILCSPLLFTKLTSFAATPTPKTERPDIEHPLYDLNYNNDTISGIYANQLIEDFLTDFSDDFVVSVWKSQEQLFNGSFETDMIIKLDLNGQYLGTFTISELPERYPKPMPMAANSYGYTSMFRGKNPLNFVTSEYGMRNGKMHGGIDISWSGIGGTNIYAVKAGKVIESRFESSWGNTVMIDHGDKTYTRYAHMRDTPKVKVGNSVTQQTLLGVVGTTGNSTGNHLHFEVCVNGSSTSYRTNPRPYLVGAGDPVADGWVTENGIKYYYVNGQKHKGEKSIGGYWYYFHASTGAMQTGFVQIPNKNKKCYYNSSGQMQYGELSTGGYWYYLHPTTGAVQTGFVDVPVKSGGQKKCYYDSNGRMQKGELKINGYWYYFHASTGAMQTGFVQIPDKDKKCYYNSSGQMQYGEISTGGYWYYLHPTTGAVQKGFVDVPEKSGGTKKCYYDNEGRMVKGEKAIGGYWYYFLPSTGAMQTGFVDVPDNSGTKRCYYDSNGRMQYGELKIDGYWYYFHLTRGTMQTGWVDLGEKICYYNSSGQMQYGEQQIDGYWYYLHPTKGSMQTGWRTEGSSTYYYHADGKKAFGSQTIDGNEYYFRETNGQMLIDEWVDGNYYGSDGIKVEEPET